MQEEITQRTVSLSVEAGKMTADLLQKAVKKVLEEMQKKPSQRTLHQGKQTLHQLKQHGASLTNIEITEQNIKAFSVVAKKYDIDYALKKDPTTEPPHYYVFFKAKDMDEFFRQHDPQYAAVHPEEHAAKEEIYENLSDCHIASLEEKLKALGQTPEDYLPSELEKFKEAVGYEAYLDVDPQVIREAIENPDQSHVDEMLAFAEQANREYEAELYGQQAAPTPDDRETGETVRTPRGTFHVTDLSREQMEAAGYGFHHESEDGKYLIMANGSHAFAIPSGDAPEHTVPEKLTVLVVEPMKESYVKEIDPGLHALQAEVGGDIAASYPFDDPVGLVLNDEGKLIGLDLNRSLRDEHGEIYDIVAGTFLVVGLGEESFTSLPPELAQKYMGHFKQPEQFINLNGQIVALPVEAENPLRTAEMTLEDDYGMIDGIINNGRRGEELEKTQDEARRTTPEKKPSIRERLEDAKRECGERKPPDKAHQKKPPEHDL